MPFELPAQQHAPELLSIADTLMQVALAADEPLAATASLLPTTRARWPASVGGEDEALAVLRPLAPCRLDALQRAFPDDPATNLARQNERAPHR